MCGRYLMMDEAEILLLRYGAVFDNSTTIKKGEIYPNENVPVIVNESILKIKEMKWGFNLPKGKKQIINARCETVFEKPLFRNSFIQRRCIIPANAFFEWQNNSNIKIKYKIGIKDEKLFSIAGFYSILADNSGKPYNAFIILTTSSNEKMGLIHNRMPVIIERDREKLYLDKNTNLNEIQSLLKPFDESLMTFQAVI